MTAASNGAAIQKAAKAYIRLGWRPIPYEAGTKGPKTKGWAKWKITENEIAERFHEGTNIGIVLGAASRGLVDIDLDCPEAVQAAPLLLPPTGAKFGQEGKEPGHWLYQCRPAPKNQRFQDPRAESESTILEVRAEGLQTMFPPSLHPNGRRIVWAERTSVPAVDKSALVTAASRLAAAVLLGRHWAAPGGRHQASLALAGGLSRLGWDRDAIMDFMRAVCLIAGDGEADDRLRAVTSTLERDDGEPTIGFKTLAEIIDPAIVFTAAKWLGYRQTDGGKGRPGGYAVSDGCIVRIRLTKDGPVNDTLAFFEARIAEEIIEDDGAERVRRWVMEGSTPDGRALPRAVITAAEYPSMSWVSREWGTRAVVAAGQAAKDSLREAIQRLSGDVPERYIYAHTGWRQIGGRWAFLHAGGALGAEGVEVRLPDRLARYVLPTPPGDLGETREAVRTALDLTKLFDDRRVGFALLSALARAPLAGMVPATVTLWVYGPSGAFKTTTTTLGLSLYGLFTEHTPPESWLSTENALERSLWTLADLPLVIDDFAPANTRDAERVRQTAQGLLRRLGNHVGRNRLRSDLSAAPSRPPRALAIVTAEELPSGRLSGLARLFPVPVERGQVHFEVLGRLQGQRHALNLAGAAYVEWLRRLRDHDDALPRKLLERQETIRSQAAGGGHPRVADNVAVLALGLETWADVAVGIGAIPEAEGRKLAEEGLAALLDLAEEHHRLLDSEAPERLLLDAIGELVASNRVAIVRLGQGDAGGVPIVGWYDTTHLYLLPEVAYKEAEALLARGRGLAASPQSIWRALEKQGAIVRQSEDRLTSKLPVALIGGGRPRVVRLSRERLRHLGFTLGGFAGTGSQGAGS
ncbi:bifunctional DNA primase/polymerase [Carboxydochorda subterranea]|uniref:Bifunctional DNA primase/polymerase n=1 Tax=Carboxydichorda subterranea TaxID=3109565 RepID=A0ABZ1BWV2_9FIRM|nr:bifunctional DNA primase/polymerase [Limnochorda sp. L945t]WRP17159.1 bifunctional DNA primase/polymerase [Limnochorda sp. L945t]